MDLERFARALRPRLWFQWTQKERAWNNLEVPCDDERDRQLFNASTIVTMGNGRTASFWTSSWIHGDSPRNIAPSLFKKARREKKSKFITLFFFAIGEYNLFLIKKSELHDAAMREPS